MGDVNWLFNMGTLMKHSKTTATQAIFKFNNGNGALLCSGCYIIIKEGYQFSEEEWKALRGEVNLESQYCEICKKKSKTR